MAWLPHSGLSSSGSPRPSLLQRAKSLFLTSLLLIFVFALFASFPLVILFVPKPEIEHWTPLGIKCATCAEIIRHNPMLAHFVDGEGVEGRIMGCMSQNRFKVR